MKQKRDHSMVYAVLAGPFVMIILILLIDMLTGRVGLPPNISYPDGSAVERTDTHGGFHGDGVETEIVKIPKMASDQFTQQLLKKRFSKTPVPTKIQEKLQSDSGTGVAADISNGVWWFQDDCPDENSDYYSNYTFKIFNLDTCTYYSIEYDS